MTTPTWEPVGQEVLEHHAAPYHEGTEAHAIAAELLAARALLVGLVEAEDAMVPAALADNEADYEAAHETCSRAVKAIRAHVAHIKEHA